MGSHPQTLDALSKITREIDSGRKNLPPYQVRLLFQRRS
jgi:hypothetical protein